MGRSLVSWGSFATDILQAIVLGIVQGVGEFLPISSSAHLYLVPWLLGWPQRGLAFDVALHMGSLVAVLLVFWRDLRDLARAAIVDGPRTPAGRLGWGILLGTFPGMLAGALLENAIQTTFRSPLLMAFNLAVVGLLLYAVDRSAAKTKTATSVNIPDMLCIGVAQALAVVPGVSRSGVTMTAGLLRNLDRQTAARVSFLLSFPIILGAGVWELRHLQAADLSVSFWTGVITAGLVGYAVIRFLLDYLRRGTFLAFAIYRLALAGAVVLSHLTGFRGGAA